VVGTVAGCDSGDPELIRDAIRDLVERIQAGSGRDRRRRYDRADGSAVVEKLPLPGRRSHRRRGEKSGGCDEGCGMRKTHS
jgi:hypothetical protein